MFTPRLGPDRDGLGDHGVVPTRCAWGAWLRVESGVVIGRDRKGVATVPDVENVTSVLGAVIEQMNDLVRHRGKV